MQLGLIKRTFPFRADGNKRVPIMKFPQSDGWTSRCGLYSMAEESNHVQTCINLLRCRLRPHMAGGAALGLERARTNEHVRLCCNIGAKISIFPCKPWSTLHLLGQAQSRRPQRMASS